MQTTELLKAALDSARARGFQIRVEKLEGVAPGSCRLGGQKVVFLEVSSTAREQLATVLAALREDEEAKMAARPKATPMVKPRVA